MLLNRSEGLLVIRLIFKAAFVCRPGPYKSDKAPGDDGKKDHQDKQESASALHIKPFACKSITQRTKNLRDPDEKENIKEV